MKIAMARNVRITAKMHYDRAYRKSRLSEIIQIRDRHTLDRRRGTWQRWDIDKPRVLHNTAHGISNHKAISRKKSSKESKSGREQVGDATYVVHTNAMRAQRVLLNTFCSRREGRSNQRAMHQYSNFKKKAKEELYPKAKQTHAWT